MWYNVEAIRNEHKWFREHNRFVLEYADLVHGSGAVRIGATGRKSGYRSDETFNPRAHFVAQGSKLTVRVAIPKDSFPELQCEREFSADPLRDVIRVKDPTYLEKVLRSIDQEYSLPSDHADFLLQMMNDWLALGGDVGANAPSDMRVSFYIKSYGTFEEIHEQRLRVVKYVEPGSNPLGSDDGFDLIEHVKTTVRTTIRTILTNRLIEDVNGVRSTRRGRVKRAGFKMRARRAHFRCAWCWPKPSAD